MKEPGVNQPGPIPPVPEPFDIRHAKVLVKSIRGRIVRNPAYPGEPTGIYGWNGIPIEATERKPRFHAALRDSLQNEGMRNPLVGYSTPSGLWLSFGSSRLRCARDIGMEVVPMIINDYIGKWKWSRHVTRHNWRLFFKDVPRFVEFGETGFDYHYALERNRRHEFDEAGLAWAPADEDFTRAEFKWLYEDKT